MTRVRAGPTAVRQLADWGAEVIKIEAPPGPGEGLGGPRHGPDFQNLHRNKRSLTLDLKAPEGIEIFRKLVRDADVVVENYRPDVKTRLGIDYEALKAINPRLVYASISGFGQSGPYRDRPGFDQIAQGMGGLMSITGLPGQGPVRVGIPVADLSAGIFCAMGILVALLGARGIGPGPMGRELAAGGADRDARFPGGALADRARGAGAGRQRPSDQHPDRRLPHPRRAHQYRLGRRRDFPPACAGRLDAPDLADHPDYRTGKLRSDNRKALNAAIEAITETRDSAEWIERFNKAGVPAGPIYTMDQVFADPQVKHLGIAQPVEHPTLGRLELVGQAVTLSRTPSRLATRQPRAGRAQRANPARTRL